MPTLPWDERRRLPRPSVTGEGEGDGSFERKITDRNDPLPLMLAGELAAGVQIRCQDRA